MSAALDPRAVAGDATLASNRRTVLAFYDACINQKDFRAAARFVGARYVQHNPLIADGRAGLEVFVRFLRETFPRLRSDVKRVLADGDLVAVHAHGVRVPGQLGSAIVDIFRLEDGKIVEHWDVIQPIPEEAANTNGML